MGDFNIHVSDEPFNTMNFKSFTCVSPLPWPSIILEMHPMSTPGLCVTISKINSSAFYILSETFSCSDLFAPLLTLCPFFDILSTSPFSPVHWPLYSLPTCLLIASLGFPGDSEVKASACSAGDLASIPGSGRSPGEGNGNPLPYSCLENPMDRGAWWATVHGVAKSRTRLSDFTSL